LLEEEMVKMDEKERIRKEYFTKRQSIREIAREFHHAKNSKEGLLWIPIPQYTKEKLHHQNQF